MKKFLITVLTLVLAFGVATTSVSASTSKITKRAILGTGTIKSKSDSSLVVTKDDKDYTVNITDKTQLRRRFWGKSTLSEMQTGDTVNVVGRFTDDKTAINAVVVRDLSIQKRFGVFLGTVKSINSGVIVVTTVERGDQTVTTSSTTKFVNRKEETIAVGDVKIGDRIRVKGMWDRSANTVTEVTHVKDFNLPAKSN